MKAREAVFDLGSCPRLPDVERLCDGELAPERADEVRAHTGSCLECASEYQEWERFQALLREGDPASPLGPVAADRLERALLVRAGATTPTELPALPLRRSLRWKTALFAVAPALAALWLALHWTLAPRFDRPGQQGQGTANKPAAGPPAPRQTTIKPPPAQSAMRAPRLRTRFRPTAPAASRRVAVLRKASGRARQIVNRPAAQLVTATRAKRAAPPRLVERLVIDIEEAPPRPIPLQAPPSRVIVLANISGDAAGGSVAVVRRVAAEDRP